MPDVEGLAQGSLVGPSDTFVLDHAAWTSLHGAHSRLAEVNGRAARYPPDVAPFAAVAPNSDAHTWDDLAALVGAGRVVPIPGDASPPEGWEVVRRGDGVQMVDTALSAEDDREAIRLEPADVQEMLALVGRTKPGPFLPRTIELGDYWGIRRDGALVAMAGERLHPPGWTEISAVCTDADFRGQGLATRLVKVVAAGIRRRNETPFLNARADNINAIRLYQAIGFTLRRRTVFQQVRVPRDWRSG